MSISIYLLSGHLVRHTWKDCSIMLHVNPIEALPLPGATCLDRWETNTRLMKMYIGFTEYRLSKLRTFLDDQPKVKKLIKEYVLCLLHTKPDSVLDFTIKYFTSMNADQTQNAVHFE